MLRAPFRGSAVAVLTACSATAPGLVDDGVPRISTSVGDYDVVWYEPSEDASGSMPIGNGEVGCNVWYDRASAELCCYVARTDAWSEASRLLKLGEVRIELGTGLRGRLGPFGQWLRLQQGCIEMHIGGGTEAWVVRLFVDAERDVIHVTGEGANPLPVRVTGRTWRNGRKVLQGDELASSWTMQGAPAGIEVVEAADR
jgi:hypothetical protein